MMRLRPGLAATVAGLTLTVALPSFAQSSTVPVASAQDGAAPAAQQATPVHGADAVSLSRPSAPTVARVRVVDPYLDIRSGPGRGYPVFYAAERHEWIVIELQRTDWFKVRTARGLTGWVSRAQMSRTVTEDGVPFELADPTLRDYLDRRFELGAGYGATPTTALTRAWAGWRFSDAFSVEVVGGNVQGPDYTISLWTAGLLAEPWAHRRLSPFMGVGLGQYHYKPNASLVDSSPNDGHLAVLSLGVRYYLASRIALRVEYLRYAANVSESESYNVQAGTIGLSIHY